jgi:hypothetical protein
MDTTQDLHGFSQFLATRLAAGDNALPEEMIALWRSEHPLPAEIAHSVESLQHSLDDLEAGRTEDFDAVNDAIRKSHGWRVN